MVEESLPKLADYNVLGKLGEGGQAYVYLIESKATKVRKDFHA